ncbi:hypothetical protein GF374_02870 [Candidatus Woesearchaeota archaeon]|nr:hypothetical protein [Candidatus Woesearchaeota archaeon]
MDDELREKATYKLLSNKYSTRFEWANLQDCEDAFETKWDFYRENRHRANELEEEEPKIWDKKWTSKYYKDLHDSVKKYETKYTNLLQYCK